MRLIVGLVLVGIVVGMGAGGLLRAQAYINQQAELYVARLEAQDSSVATKTAAALPDIVTKSVAAVPTPPTLASVSTPLPASEIDRLFGIGADAWSDSRTDIPIDSWALGAATSSTPATAAGDAAEPDRASRKSILAKPPQPAAPAVALDAGEKAAVDEPATTSRIGQGRFTTVRVSRPGAEPSIYSVPRE